MQDGDENLASYLGQLRPADINATLAHLYRAQITRADSWRNRLDVTTNWALLSTAAAISFAFGQPTIHHSVILLDTLLITLFLSIETRRVRYYELWSYRVRLLETDFYAALIVPPFRVDPELADKLVETLLNPQFPISKREALGRRLRRNYLWIYFVLLFAWVAKLVLSPNSATSLDQVVTRAQMGFIPGELVMLVVLVFYMALIVIALSTLGLRQASGEVFPRYGSAKPVSDQPPVDAHLTIDPAKTAPFLAIVTSEQMDAIAAQIQEQFKRAPTRLDPNNTTGTQAALLLPLSLAEIATLKSLVSEIDAQASVTVISAAEVYQQSAQIQDAAK